MIQEERRKMRWSWPLRIAGSVVVMNLAGYLWIIWLLIYPPTVYRFLSPVTPVGVWRAGGPIQYRMHVEKIYPLPAKATTYLRNEKYLINVDGHDSNLPTGIRDRISTGDLNPDIPPGKYYFGWSGTWRVNWLRTETVKSESVDMVEILPAVGK